MRWSRESLWGALLIALSPLWARAVSLSLPDISASTGDTVQVVMAGTAFTNIGAVTLKIGFGDTVLSYEGVESHVDSATFLGSATDGILSLAWVDMTGTNPIDEDDGPVMTLTFVLVGDPGSSAVLAFLPATELADGVGNPIVDAVYEDGSVTLVGTDNAPPVLHPIGDREVALGDTLRLVLSASDPDGGALTFVVSGNRVGSSLVDSLFTWPPVGGQPSIDIVTFTVQDAHGATDSETIAIIEPPLFAIPLEPGWNLVSLAKPTTNDSIVAVVAEIGDNLTRILGFETASINPNPPLAGGKLYDTSVPDFVNTLLLTDPRLGYWLKMSAGDTLYSGAPLAKPATRAAGGRGDQRHLRPVFDFVGLWGSVTLDGEPAPVGAVVDVLDAGGNLAGQCEVRHPGYYGFLPVYRDNLDTEIDEGAETGEWLTVRVNGQPTPHLVQWTEFGDVVRMDMEVSTRAASRLPRDVALGPIYPNPFNSGTTIAYQLASREKAVLSIHNLAGQRVATLANAWHEAGHHTLRWDGLDQDGERQASGVYLCRLRAGQHVETRKLALVR